MYSMCPSWRSTLTVRHYVNADHVGSVWRCRRSPLGARGRSGQEPTGAKQRCLADASLPFTVPLAGGRVVSPTVSLYLPSLCCEAQASPKVPTPHRPLTDLAKTRPQNDCISTSSSTYRHGHRHGQSKPAYFASPRLPLVSHNWHRCAWCDGAVRYQPGARAPARLGHWEADHGGRWGVVLVWERCTLADVRCLPSLLIDLCIRYRCMRACLLLGALKYFISGSLLDDTNLSS